MSGQKSNCLELVEFQFNSEVSPAEAQQALQKLSEFAQSQPGFERRQFTEVQHPRYVDMVWWSSLESAQNAADAAMKSTFCAPIFAKMDPQSVKMGHYLSVAS